MRAGVLLVVLGTMLGCGGDDAPVAPDADTGPAPTPIFLNRGGGVYTGGANDSSANTTVLVDGSHTFVAFELDDTRWDGVLACLADRFAAFNVEITDVDPGQAQHLEALLLAAEDWATLPFAADSGGVSPFQCSPLPRPIILVNAAAFSDADDGLCESIAQGIGSTQSVDHLFHCPDLMSYLIDCGPKTFVDAEHECGELEARECACGGTTQNSFAKLEAVFGLAAD